MEFHSSYLIIALGFVLTGHYLNLIVFTMLILVHELGHYGIARIFGCKVLKIVIYPYGGKCVLEDYVNRDLHEELLIAMAGVVVQFLFYLFVCFIHEMGVIRDYTMNLFTLYNQQMIFFNLLPIYPLDGGRIVHLFLCFLFPYYFSNLICIVSSFLVIIGIFLLDVYQCNYSNIMILGLLISYLIKFFLERKYWHYRFLLERYLYNVSFCKISIVRDLKSMYRNKLHLFKKDAYYQTEKKVLMDFFLNNNTD